ncbi:ABC transporter ATP-binding protein [Microbacterium sp. A588]
MTQSAASAQPLLQVSEVTKIFEIGQAVPFGPRARLHAVDRVSLTIGSAKTFGVVGESGSGKSTLARMVVRLTDVTSGALFFQGQDLTALRGRNLRELRQRVQMVFQDPHSSFDPASTLRDSVVEPLRASRRLSRIETTSLAGEAFEAVGLRPTLIDRYPAELSGGQLQRAAIARALITHPDLIVLDEPVSSLDVSTQGQILNLLEDLKGERGMSYLLIAHNLAVVNQVSDRIGVMYLGRLVEQGETNQVYSEPRHPYTAALLTAIPRSHPARAPRSDSPPLKGDLPSPLNPPSGCRFRTRCPLAMPVCAEVDPPAFEAPDGGTVHCHLHTSGPALGGASVLSVLPREPAKPLVGADGQA